MIYILSGFTSIYREHHLKKIILRKKYIQGRTHTQQKIHQEINDIMVIFIAQEFPDKDVLLRN